MHSSSVKLYHEMTLGSIIIAMETRPLEKLVILQSYIDFLSAKDLTIFAIITNQYLPQFQQYMNILTFLQHLCSLLNPDFILFSYMYRKTIHFCFLKLESASVFPSCFSSCKINSFLDEIVMEVMAVQYVQCKKWTIKN